MRWSWIPRHKTRWALALAVGLLLGAAFPKVGVAGFAWLAPGLMLLAGLGTSGGGAFRAGYVAGLSFYLSSLSWLLHIPVPFAPIVGWLALSGFLALFPGTWVWLCWRIFPEPGPPDPGRRLPEIQMPTLELQRHLGSFLLLTWRQRLAWSLACAAFWVAWEMFQARIFGGFPWNFLGASQYQMLPLIQIASVTGIYGVSFLVAWFSTSLLAAMAVIICQPARRSRSALAEVIVPLLVIVGVVAWGTRAALLPPNEQQRILKIALVQPSIPQTTIWDPNQGSQRFGQLINLTEQALAATHPDLVVWPEAAVPSLFLWDTNAFYQGQTIYEAATGLARRHKVWLILGADDAEVRPHDPREIDNYNSSFLVTPEGKVVSTYRKQKLVVFGEYVPLSKWLPFLKDFTQVYGEFTPGKGPVTYQLPSAGVSTTVLICFEDTFPHVARRAVTPDIDFLLNLTNNGWFGESAAQWQHAVSAVFRAVENGLPLVRAANNGLSCWASPRGTMHEVFFPDSRNIYKPGFKLAQVPLPKRQYHHMTFYHEHGDWLGWICLWFTLIAMAVVWIPTRPSLHPDSTSSLGIEGDGAGGKDLA